MKSDYPCHQRPHAEWCDHAGPGGFMGHTCYHATPIEKAMAAQASSTRSTDFSIWKRGTLEQLCREAMDKVHELTARVKELESRS